MKEETIKILNDWKNQGGYQNLIALHIEQEMSNEAMEEKFLEKFSSGDFKHLYNKLLDLVRSKAVNGCACVEEKEVYGIINHIIMDVEIKEEPKEQINHTNFEKAVEKAKEEVKERAEVKKETAPKPKKKEESPYEQIALF